jgi:hypothetical protein
LMVLHFVADFILQPREMGKKKSSEPKWLFKHLSIQFGMFAVGTMPIILLGYIDHMSNALFAAEHPLSLLVIAACIKAIMFSLINASIHGLIDWNIWKLYKLSAYYRIKREAKEINASTEWIAEMGKNWQYWEDHWFYTTIGFDQLLHVSTLLFLAFYLL